MLDDLIDLTFGGKDDSNYDDSEEYDIYQQIMGGNETYKIQYIPFDDKIKGSGIKIHLPEDDDIKIELEKEDNAKIELDDNASFEKIKIELDGANRKLPENSIKIELEDNGQRNNDLIY